MAAILGLYGYNLMLGKIPQSVYFQSCIPELSDLELSQLSHDSQCSGYVIVSKPY